MLSVDECRRPMYAFVPYAYNPLVNQNILQRIISYRATLTSTLEFSSDIRSIRLTCCQARPSTWNTSRTNTWSGFGRLVDMTGVA